MKTAQYESASAVPRRRGQDFNLVIAYEDFANGLCAMRFFEDLLDDMGRVFTLIPRFLKFEELQRPRLRECVAAEAAQADMVVVAANEGAELPGLVKTWLNGWRSAGNRDDRSLVALISAPAGHKVHRKPVRSLLQEVARSKGMRFLCQEIFDEEPVFPIEISGWQTRDAAFPVEIKAGPIRVEPGAAVEKIYTPGACLN